MKKLLTVLLGLGFLLTTVSPTFAQSSGKHGKKRGGGHKKGTGTRSGPAK